MYPNTCHLQYSLLAHANDLIHRSPFPKNSISNRRINHEVSNLILLFSEIQAALGESQQSHEISDLRSLIKEESLKLT